jgi:beta-galactosidase
MPILVLLPADFFAGGKPDDWTDITALSWDYTYENHTEDSPSSPYAILEYQGGAPDPW